MSCRHNDQLVGEVSSMQKARRQNVLYVKCLVGEVSSRQTVQLPPDQLCVDTANLAS